jgi:hypothetical protein
MSVSEVVDFMIENRKWGQQEARIISDTTLMIIKEE